MAVTRARSVEDGNLSSSILTSRDRKYKDIDLSFTLSPNKDLYKKTDAAAVKQAVKTLLLTGPGERPFQPVFGAGLSRLLFENATEDTEAEIDVLIRTAIENYEPRAEVIDVQTNMNLDRNELFVKVTFRVISTQQEVTLETSLSRLR